MFFFSLPPKTMMPKSIPKLIVLRKSQTVSTWTLPIFVPIHYQSIDCRSAIDSHVTCARKKKKCFFMISRCCMDASWPDAVLHHNKNGRRIRPMLVIEYPLNFASVLSLNSHPIAKELNMMKSFEF